MAQLSNYISFLLLTTLLLPLQTTARDSEFFSKVTHFNKETKIPNKEESTVTNKPEEQPPFIPQNENSYGLYGHESDHFPSTTTAATTTTTNSNFEDTNNYQNDNKYYNNDAYNTKYYNKDTFGNELSDTKYNEEQNNNNNYNNHNRRFNNNAANERSFYNNNNNNYNGEKQGMSDTRFLEGGKYYYDVSYEKYNPTMYNPTMYSDSSRGINNDNWYNNRGNSNNDNNYGNNNEYYQNNHGNYNGYKNQHEFENEEDAFKP
ncbi:protein E6-like [Trifolium pratense]|uniref:protein E6-like n=1 Tax=Trifolium pratense TaxID=57577 RepID=UPI001E69401F|nr:protein E6-like [Trifolium pratense]